MQELQSLTKIFKEKLFRVPDYQRGYAWLVQPQLIDFWEDIMMLLLEDSKSHYTGVLTLAPIPENRYGHWTEDLWLIHNRGYKPFFVVDGQQRLTTAIILIQSILEIVRDLPENTENDKEDFELNDTPLKDIQKNFIFQKKRDSIQHSYIFGYEKDNPSYEYLKTRIFNEQSASDQHMETLYTLNLENAKRFFKDNLKKLSKDEIEKIYKKLTQNLLFNEYIIQNDVDVYVAFETMNNRGKKLSDLELLKNRLVYLTTLFRREDQSEVEILRNHINDCWKEVYSQLGRNKNNPLNDDDFLRAHWIVYYKYSRKKGSDYIHYLLNEEFTPKSIIEKIQINITTEDIQETRETLLEIVDEDEPNEVREEKTKAVSKLQIKDIDEYVLSLQQSVKYWYNTFNPLSNSDLTQQEQEWLDKLNRIGISYFRPLIMSSYLNSQTNSDDRVKLFKAIERFIFIAFRLSQARSNYRNSEFYNASRLLYKNETTVDKIIKDLNERLKFAFNDDGSYKISSFHDYISNKFKYGAKNGFYGWSGLRYFLYEYELSLMQNRGQKKIDWKLFIKSEDDKVSIEHILPQTPDNDYWREKIKDFSPEQITYLTGSLGNLLPLSMAINSSLQNDTFEDKKRIKYDSSGNVLRNGYKNGSYSEIQVANSEEWLSEEWSSKEIMNRGLKMLKFLEGRWDINLGDENRKKQFLYIDFLT